jgi:hypothetical protein
MKKIFKYLIDGKDISLPAGSKILSVTTQQDNIVLYALVDPDIKDKMVYSFLVIGTGHEIKKDLNDYTFSGTVSLLGGELMFHIWYKLGKYLPG